MEEKTYRYIVSIITEEENFEVRFNIMMIRLAYLDKSCIPDLKKFLDSTGRIKFIRPLYQGYIKIDREDARKTFDELKFNYHPILVAMVEKVFSASSVNNLSFLE